MSARKLNAWESAGLIDAETASRIRSWEAENSRPLAMWAIIGLGALTIGLGLISVVVANWDKVLGEVRLAVHLAALAAMLVAVWRRATVNDTQQPWLSEALLFIAGMIGLTFMGHVGQVYQTSSPLWQPVAFWLCLFAPLLLSKGQSWLVAAMIMVATLTVIWGHVAIYAEQFERANRYAVLAWYLGTIICFPLLFIVLGTYLRQRSARFHFWYRIEQLGFAYAIMGTSMAAVAAGFDRWSEDRLGSTIWGASAIQGVALGLAGLAVWLLRPTQSGRATGAVLGLAGVVLVSCYPLSGGDLLPALLFFALWGGVAAASLHAGWRGVFQLAVALLAIRLIVLSFELAGDLLMSGVGLIIAGLLILAVAWVAVRVSKRFAPVDKGEVQ